MDIGEREWAAFRPPPRDPDFDLDLKRAPDLDLDLEPVLDLDLGILFSENIKCLLEIIVGKTEVSRNGVSQNKT